MITWGDPNARIYHHGLDRGVLYIPNGIAVPWVGLTGFDETSEGATTELYYRDGEIYLADAEPGDFKGQLTTITYPDEFGDRIGFPQVANGFYADNQRQKPFHLSYRTLVGSGTEGDMFGHQIHLIYNCMATIGSRTRRTIGKDTAPTEFVFDIVCTPVKLQGYRPTAHYVIDTRGTDPFMIETLENILYGEGSGIEDFIDEPIAEDVEARMPTPQELYDIMSAGVEALVS